MRQRIIHRGRPAAGAIASALLAAVAFCATASASPFIHAHRGGSLTRGVPALPENSYPAFRRAARLGFVLELDVKRTADGALVVFHDPELDRLTPCKGLISERAYAELRRSCRIDILGTEGNERHLRAGDRRRRPAPTLAAVLRLARRSGAELNIEIKNPPTDPDFDASGEFADAVVEAIIRSRVPLSKVIVQSFWPADIDTVEGRLPRAETSLLTLAALNDGAPAFAKARGYEWVSPQWPVSAAFVSSAHASGLRVVPYTLDSAEQIRAAFAAGVDAVISNDPLLARSVISRAAGPPPRIPPPPSRSTCRQTNANRTLRPIRAFDPAPRAPRVFAMQFKQELRHVESYRSFRTKIECMVRRYVLPFRARGRPNVVAFNEDVGLMTLGTGSRGAGARALFADPESAPSCEQQGVPCGVVAALASVTAGYAPQVAAYRVRFGDAAQVPAAFVAATDTFARGWMQVFSDIARRYRLYILGSNNQAPFRESRDEAEIDQFRDPDLPRPRTVYVATSDEVFNEVFMWGPRFVRREGPPMLRNVVARNKKVPLTPIEQQLELTPGPSRGPDAVANVRPYRLPGTRARIAFATSLPAFVYGHQLGTRPPAGNPCSDTARFYMRCLQRLRANLVMQDEANSGRWAALGGQGAWQPLEWMGSTWRAAADPTVSFAYNVTPHMVGNLADLAFDGQTAITQRGLRGRPGAARRCTYVGNARFHSGPGEFDPPAFRRYAGRKRQFVAIVPWVSRSGSRDKLRATSARLAPGSGDPLENDYLETAVIADLPFPPRARRPNCLGAR